jgi:UDP-glucose 4-epimerase
MTDRDFDWYVGLHATRRTYEDVLYSSESEYTPLSEFFHKLTLVNGSKDAHHGFESTGIFLSTSNYGNQDGFDLVIVYQEIEDVMRNRLKKEYKEFMKRDGELAKAIAEQQSFSEEMIEKQDIETLKMLARKYKYKVEPNV